jgi:putative sterol carrier protein
MPTLPAVPGDITPRAFFEEFLVENFEALTEGKVKNVDAVLQVRVTGDGGGTWALTVREGRIVVRPEADAAALAFMEMPIDVWRTIMERGADLAVATGGNVSGAFKFLFPEPQMTELIRNTFQGTAEVRLRHEAQEPLQIWFGFKECNARAPKTKVTMALSDWMDLAARKTVPAQLYMSGKATVEGDMALAMNMSMLLT